MIDANALSYYVGSINSEITPVDAFKSAAYDQNTNKFTIKHDGISHPGFVATPSWPSSIVKGVRIYTSNNYKSRDPLSYILYGRSGPYDDWNFIAQEAFSITRSRNQLGIPIVSTFESGDTTRNMREMHFENDVAYSEYKIVFPTNKGDSSRTSMAEVELPGILV